jgi:hypothetical protein
MGRSKEIPAEPAFNPPDHLQKLADVLEARHDEEIEPKYLEAAALALDAMYDRFGIPEEPSYHTFHNHIHAMNVGTGSWIVLDFMHDKLKLPVQSVDYPVGLLIGSLHDIFHERTVDGFVIPGSYTVDFGKFAITVESDGTQTNEELSALCAIKFLEKLDLDEVKNDVALGIRLTEVSFENGNVIQVNAGKGGDSYGAIAAAIADTDGIFAGKERLTKDGGRLITETFGEQVADDGFLTTKIIDFFYKEPGFIDQKLNEFHLHIFGTAEGDPIKLKALKERLDEHFEPFQAKALGAAALFDARVSNMQQFHDTVQVKVAELREEYSNPVLIVHHALAFAISTLENRKKDTLPKDAI